MRVSRTYGSEAPDVQVQGAGRAGPLVAQYFSARTSSMQLAGPSISRPGPRVCSTGLRVTCFSNQCESSLGSVGYKIDRGVSLRAKLIVYKHWLPYGRW